MVQRLLCLLVLAGHPHAAGQPDQLQHRRVHHRHRLPNGPVQGKLRLVQGHISIDQEKGCRSAGRS
ncbi:MAG: hypothetical protein ACLR1T_07065 [Evtepia gabavorous]